MVQMALDFLTGVITIITTTDLMLFFGLALVLSIMGFIYKQII